jgi:4-amino-4-deoxy-L-arabinose transferase-like glycosyltransferase
MGISRSILEALAVLPLGFMFLWSFCSLAEGADRTRAIVDGYLALAIVSYALTEVFSLFHAIALLPLLTVWVALDAWLVYRLRGHWNMIHRPCQTPKTLPFLIVAAIASITFFIALTTVPNNWDSQTYHLPRIEHWFQDGSLAFYPTSITRQNDMGPVAEILLLQLRVLGGSDFFYPLLQWISMLCSVAAAYRITRQLGGSEIQGWIAAVFLATLPIGILESTSTQNDYVVAALLCCFVTLGLEAVQRPETPFGLVLAAVAAAGLSGMAKPIGFLLGSGFALWFAFARIRRSAPRAWPGQAAGVVIVLALILGPFTARYLAAHDQFQSEVEGSLINRSLGVEQTLDNLLRHGVSNLVTGIPQLDALTYRLSLWIASGWALDRHRDDTTVPQQLAYVPPIGLYVFHEDNAPNPIHLILVAAAALMSAARWRAPAPAERWIYWGAWVFGVIAFSAVLRWGLWQVRFHLPAFALAGPLVATAWPERWSGPRATATLFLFLGFTSLPVLFLNQSRELIPLSRNRPLPLLRDRPSYLSTSETERLFVNQQHLLGPYRDAVETIVRSRATQIGLVLGGDSWEYPIWRMLRDRNLGYSIRIEHVGLPSELPPPLGPFLPEALFWNNGDAPPTLEVGGREFVRAGPRGAIAVYTRAGLTARSPSPFKEL